MQMARLPIGHGDGELLSTLRIVIAHHSTICLCYLGCTIFLCYLGGTLFSGIWDDHDRNPSINNNNGGWCGRRLLVTMPLEAEAHWSLTASSLPPVTRSHCLQPAQSLLNNVLPLQTCQHEMANNAFAIDQAIATKLLLPAMSLHQCWNCFTIVVAIIADITLLSTSATLITLPLLLEF